jgi:hypothetical protein
MNAVIIPETSLERLNQPDPHVYRVRFMGKDCFEPETFARFVDATEHCRWTAKQGAHSCEIYEGDGEIWQHCATWHIEAWDPVRQALTRWLSNPSVVPFRDE